MKRFLLALFALISVNFLVAQTNISGSIATDSTLTLAGSPYIVTGNLTVNSGVTLTVNAGVQVQLTSSRRLYVYGTLNATNATFTSNEGSPAAGDWDFIEVNGSSGNPATATFTNCQISYGQEIYVYDFATINLIGSDVSDFENYGLYLESGGVANLNNVSSISNCNNGVRILNGNLVMNNSDITNCTQYGIFISSALATISLTDVEISNCDWPINFSASGSLTLAGTNNFTGNTHDGVYMAQTNISDALNLPTIEIPYYFYYTSNITIAASGSVTVADNNILKFDGNVLVDGIFNADASVGSNIFITSVRDDNWGGDTNGDGSLTAPAVSDWGGIRYRSGSQDASNILRRCMIRYGGTSAQYGAVDCENASPTINLCEFQSNYFGATFRGASDPIFTFNTIGSSAQTPIAMTFDANPTFNNNSFSFLDNNYDAIGLLGGTLTRNANLIQRDVTSIPNVTYVLLATVTVPLGDTLNIDAGIVIKPIENYQVRLFIDGALMVNGSPAERVVFTSIKDDNHGNPQDTNKDGTITVPDKQDWGGIIFNPGSGGIIDYSRVKYADYYNYFINTYRFFGAIHINNASPTISNTEIKDVDYGIVCLNTSLPTITNNEITNTTYTPITLSASSDPTFGGNVFTNTGLTALGIAPERIANNGVIKNRDVAGFTNITYVLIDDILIQNGANIDVDPGVVIKARSGAGILVAGGFSVSGTAPNKVYFTSVLDDNLGNPGDTNGDGNATAPAPNNWGNIMYISTANDPYNTINNAVVSYTGTGSYSSSFTGLGNFNSQGAISFENAGGTVMNSTVDNAYYYGLETDGNSNPTFNTVTIQNCRLDPVAMSLLSDPTFVNITFTANGSKGVRLIEGTLSSDAHLEKRDIAGITNVAYIIGSNSLTITSNAVLTVDPGVVLKFDYVYSKITVNGGLKLLGDVGNKIILTSINDDSAGGDTNNDGNTSVPAAGNWDALIYNTTAFDTASIVQNVEIRYGGYSLGSDASLVINSAYALIDNVTIQQANQWGIRITGSANPDIQNCSFLNIGNGPIWMSMFSDPTFTNNTALNSNYMALGIISETWSQNATIPKRNFAGNTNITYLLTGNITINTGTEIDFPDGVSFKRLSTSYEFTVNGRVNVNGTGGNKVSFTDYRDDRYGVPADMNQDGSATIASGTSGNWFIINDVSDDLTNINHAIFAYASDAIDCNSASPTVQNSLFENSSYGLRLDGVSNPNLTNNTFNDLTYAPFRTSLVSYPASTTGNTISGTTYKCIGVINETLVQDVTLSKRDFAGVTNIPYLFDNYTIGSGATLTFQAGVVNKFFSGRSIIVHKGFIAEGAEGADNNIVFTSIEDDFYGGDSNSDGDATEPNTSEWNGIRFESDALDPLSRLDHCVFRFAGSNTTYGAITANSASPSIQNTLFHRCESALVATGAANPTINFCDFNELDNHGVYNRDQSFIINAENNWWGDNTGPTHSGNPGGTGEPVTDAVDYDPWSLIVENPLMGDVSLNGEVQAYDASLVLQHVVAPFLVPDQLLVADVSGIGGVSALDAALILQFVVGIIDVFPAEEVRTSVDYSVSNVQLEIGSTEADPDDLVTLPVSIKNVSNVLGLDIVLEYDPTLLTLSDVVFENTTMQNIVDFETPGLIKIAMASTETLEADEVLANLSFIVASDIAVEIAPIKVQSFLANETDLKDISIDGEVSIRGAITSINQNATGLLPLYPNPFKDVVSIQYQLEKNNQLVQINVYNSVGKKVAVLVNDFQQTGRHSIQWDATKNGQSIGSGYYYIQLITGAINETKKVLLLN